MDTKDTKNLSPEESLQIIRSMMEEGQNRLGFDGKLIALWGALLTVAFLVLWAAVKGYVGLTALQIWVPVFIIGSILSSLVATRSDKSAQNYNNPILRGYSAAWGSVGISMMIAFFAMVASGNTGNEWSLTIVMGAVIGGALFVIAHLSNIRWLYFVSACWWGLEGWAMVTTGPNVDHILLLAFMCFALIFLPGLKLMKDCQKA